MNCRGQAAIEFLLLFGFMIMVFTVFTVLIQERSASKAAEADRDELARIGETILAEAQLAARVHDGYSRVFRIPLMVSRGAYTVTLQPSITPSEIVISDGQDEYVVFLPINLTTGSTVEPGLNLISRDNGTASIEALAPSGTMCADDSDCAAGYVCRNYLCIACIDEDDDGYYSTSSPAVCGGNDCDDEDEDVNPGAHEYGHCSDGTDNDCDGTTDEEDSECPVCALPLTSTVYFAGGTTIADGGTSWNARTTGGEIGVCCNTNTQCAVDNGTAYSCTAHGLIPRSTIMIPSTVQSTGYATDREWICANMTGSWSVTPTGPKLFHCTSANDGALVINTTNGFCCSRFTNSAQEHYDTWGFNPGFVGGTNKGENLTVFGSCSDGSDNDCDGKRDGYDDLCWNAIINSTCGGNTAFEDLTAYPNSTMHGTGEYTTRFVYDWRVGSASFAEHQYTFDYDGDAGVGMARDHSLSSANMTTALSKPEAPTWVLSDGTHRGLFEFDGTTEWANVTTADPTGAYSIEMWIRPDDTADRNVIAITALDPLTTYSHQIRLVYAPGFMPNYRIVHYLWDGAARTVTSTDSYPVGGWHHVVATATPSGAMRLYVDGVETGTSVTIGTPYAGGTRWVLGAATGGGFASYDGAIDEVRIYHRALSARQVQSLYDNGYKSIVSQELVVGQRWNAHITPTNSTHHGARIISNRLDIVSGPSACATACACVQPDASCATVGEEYDTNACSVCSASGWTPKADGASCGDGLACNGVDSCQSGTCEAGVVISCEEPTPYCIEPSAACVECIGDGDCGMRCEIESTKDGFDVVFYSAGSCSGNTCTGLTPEVCHSQATEPSDASNWCHDAEVLPLGCCGPFTFECPAVDK